MGDHRVDVLIARAGPWAEVFAALRAILLDLGFAEGFKWRQADYMVEGRNVLLISTLKDSCALNFFKGALLPDPEKLLRVPGPNSQSARWMKFSSLDEVRRLEPVIRAYARAALENEAAGRKVVFAAKDALDYPDELLAFFEEDPVFAQAYHALTPGRQRSWILHYTSAKQAATRVNRVAKSREPVLAGKGWNER